MILRPFHTSDYSNLVEMHKSQGYDISTLDEDSIPEIGFIVFKEDIPAAAGFLRKVEGGYAQIDTLVSNKVLNSQERHSSIKLVVDSLLEMAKALELKGIVSYTKEESVLSRARIEGFTIIDNCSVICIKFEGKNV